MDGKWFERLKEARIRANITLREASALEMFDISQQTLVKYEKGEVFPRIDLLEKMCKKYSVTIDYILYGTSDLAKTTDLSGHLVSLFMLLHSGKLAFDEKNRVLEIKDQRLSTQIMVLDTFCRTQEISSIEELFSLIEGIKKLSKEQG